MSGGVSDVPVSVIADYCGTCEAVKHGKAVATPTLHPRLRRSFGHNFESAWTAWVARVNPASRVFSMVTLNVCMTAKQNKKTGGNQENSLFALLWPGIDAPNIATNFPPTQRGCAKCMKYITY